MAKSKRTSGSWAGWLAAVSLTVLLSHALAASISANGSESQDQTLLTRKAVIGTSQRVKKLLVTNPQGHQYHKALSQVLVEERSAPQSCGVRTAKFFRQQIVSTFQVAALDSCFISDKKVHCATDDLPGYSKVYLSLVYKRAPTEVDLSLTVQQRGIWGTIQRATLDPEHVEWFEVLFDCLVSIVECNEALPPCAQRLSRSRSR